MIIQDMKQRIVNNSKRAFFITNNELFWIITITSG